MSVASLIWQQAEQGSFAGVDGVPIHYAVLRHPQERGAIALCTGRVETYLKYHELVDDLYGMGFTLYLWDHRGQGLSGRMLANPQVGHVARFDDYVADMHELYQTLIAPAGHRHLALLGHSMGGAIATTYLQRYPDHFQAAVLSAPMYGILLPAPKALLQPLVALMATFAPGRYVPGGNDYDPVRFEENELTGDARRYAEFRALYEAWPGVKLGDPSLGWLAQALKQIDKLTRMTVSVPILVLQAGDDNIVDNEAQQAFCERQPHHQLLTYQGARHEILIEQDPIRSAAINAAEQWWVRHGAAASSTVSAASPVAAER
ncbi:alpha/beta fold hydrolase [Ferrimonas balearica]|uniref:alpha/beta fold hydrolase n=1 Tax=Ferrimonas balearica TaxID=44012 RepID=UPI001C99E110|nr:alpha/beta fold hydrolase [Ferrimonas balearica]MBY5922766.1 alpha/beta fold hydrolase [Ferrimonas balearica]MBY5995750.1 alpha/beta fold hydrolase [Ferrimonas balearica]